MATTTDVLTVAVGELGYAENPPGSNRSKYGEWYGINPAPWCAMFVSWAFHRAGLPLPASTPKGFAYTPAGADWFRRNGRWHTNPTVGDVVFYSIGGDRIDHVGIVDAVLGDGWIYAIEGNTNSAGSRTGGSVLRQQRKYRIAGYGRPAYSTLGEDVPNPTAIVGQCRSSNGGTFVLRFNGDVVSEGPAPRVRDIGAIWNTLPDPKPRRAFWIIEPDGDTCRVRNEDGWNRKLERA